MIENTLRSYLPLSELCYKSSVNGLVVTRFESWYQSAVLKATTFFTLSLIIISRKYINAKNLLLTIVDLGLIAPQLATYTTVLWLHLHTKHHHKIDYMLSRKKEGNVYLTMHSIYFIYDYMVLYIFSERGNPLSPHGLHFLISSKGSFILTIPQAGYYIPQPLIHQSWSIGWNKK